jgi:hypothetical protein
MITVAVDKIAGANVGKARRLTARPRATIELLG